MAPRVEILVSSKTMLAVFLILINKLHYTGSSGTELVDIAGVEGGSVSLPCPCFPPTPSTLVSLVMWFHNSAQDPFYSFDSRGPGADGRHWVSHQYSERVALNLILQENTFILHLFNLSLNDQGAFRCRVDFDTAPTQNVHINLSIIVPPSTPVLLDGWGAIIGSTFGPFKEGDTASLSCEVRGGIPKPYIYWEKNGRKISASGQVSSGSSITSRLELPVLRREDTRSLVSCFTNNNNISQQLSANTTINVLVPPVSVRIEEKRKKLVDGKIYLFNCAAEDFYPSIEYTWFLNQEILPHSKPTKGSNLSTLEIELTRHQHGSILSCRAFNPEIPDVSLQDSLVLDIYYKPVLKLELGAGLNLHNIRQSSDIYLECTADSRPALQHVRWKKDGFDITEEKKKGRLVSRTSLVLQNISSSESGRYCCTGENSEGETSSNIITVDVKFSPECSEQPENILLQKKASIQVTCGMSSNPGVEKFSWKFKNEKFEVDIPESLYTVHENTSVLKYFAHSDRDYGTLLCYASNIIGPQTKPCIFRIIQPGSGSLVIVCSTKLVSPVSVLVNCQNTKEDGLYNLQVSRLGNPVLLERNITSLKGNFKVFGLLPGSSYQARVDYLDGNNERWTSLLNFTTIELDKSIPIQDSLQESLPSVVSIEEENEPLLLKTALFLLVLVSLILLIFLASVGVICRIRIQYVGDSAALEDTVQHAVQRNNDLQLNEDISSEPDTASSPRLSSHGGINSSPDNDRKNTPGELREMGYSESIFYSTARPHQTESRIPSSSNLTRSYSSTNLNSCLQIATPPYTSRTLPRGGGRGSLENLLQINPENMYLQRINSSYPYPPNLQPTLQPTPYHQMLPDSFLAGGNQLRNPSPGGGEIRTWGEPVLPENYSAFQYFQKDPLNNYAGQRRAALTLNPLNFQLRSDLSLPPPILQYPTSSIPITNPEEYIPCSCSYTGNIWIEQEAFHSMDIQNPYTSYNTESDTQPAFSDTHAAGDTINQAHSVYNTHSKEPSEEDDDDEMPRKHSSRSVKFSDLDTVTEE